MIFNSIEFLLFLPVVFALYWFVFQKSLSKQNILILICSYFFYGWWSWKFMLLLALSTLLDFAYGFKVASDNQRKAKLFLWLSIINNLGILGVFKYYNFFAEQFRQSFHLLGIETHPLLLSVVLPVGISFYTFHGMSYVFDIYHKRIKPTESFVDYAVFVSFFPLLVAGPIERANHLLPQVKQPRIFSYVQAVAGCRLILWGLFKKVVIADNLAPIVNDIFGSYHQLNGYALLVGAVAFSFQIYGDFSGYSDIALGTAKLFGFELLSNFRFPYFSRDLAEFWRRWHLSLSSWFRDYLYIPLGGSKAGKSKAVLNTFIIFLVSGFWHGASWNYIVWGFVHACGFLPLLLLGKNRKHVNSAVANDRALPNLGEALSMIATFAYVTFAWIFFRAENLHIAVGYIQHAVVSILHEPLQFLALPFGKTAFLYILPLLVIDWWFRADERHLKMPGKHLNALIYLTIAVIIFLNWGKSNSFIYFQF